MRYARSKIKREFKRNLVKKILNKIALFLCFVFIFIAFFGSRLTPYDINNINLNEQFMPISKTHILGTDNLGRDEFSRLIYATSISLKAVFFCLFIVLILALIFGGICGFYGGIIDKIFMRICDFLLSFPTIILALFLVFILGSGLKNAIIAIALTHFSFYARIIRSLSIELKTKDYVYYTKTTGASAFKNYKTNMLKPILLKCLILSTLSIPHIMLHFCSLSFLGLGAPSQMPELGIMISEGKEFLFTNSNLIIYPGIVIFLIVTSFNILSENLKEKFEDKRAKYD